MSQPLSWWNTILPSGESPKTPLLDRNDQARRHYQAVLISLRAERKLSGRERRLSSPCTMYLHTGGRGLQSVVIWLPGVPKREQCGDGLMWPISTLS